MSRYRDAFRKALGIDLALHLLLVAVSDGFWRYPALVLLGFDALCLWSGLRLVYWTKRLHEAQADAAVLDATLYVEREYSRYLDEQL